MFPFAPVEYAALKAFSRMFQALAIPGVDLPGIDISAIASGYGCASDLAPALARSFTTPGPTVIDAVVARMESALY